MKQKHMNIDDRITISNELNKKTSFKEIGLILNKDATTISKEVRKHRCFTKTGGFGKGFNDCLHNVNRNCSKKKVCNTCFQTNKRPCWSCGKCIETCKEYKSYTCPKLNKAPYVCNGCSDKSNCTLEKAYYKAQKSQNEYEELRSESRTGFAVSEDELAYLDNVISPLLRNGQSIHHICASRVDEVMTSERTLYTYVNNNLFSARNIDMPRTVRMRPRKNKSTPLKVDKACRIGRNYEAFIQFMKNNPDTPVREIDSVEGIKGRAVLLTIHFVEQKFQLAFLRESNNSQSVIDIFEKLYWELRSDIFIEMFPVILADNGSEFSNPKAIEFDRQDNPRTKMYYCDPSAPYQKGSCENNHEFIRKIIPKGKDLGIYSQEQIDLMMSHINSYKRAKLGDKSPYEMMEFSYGKRVLDVFNIKKIPANEINLTPSLLK